MIPKVEACFEALGRGVPQAHIIDGRVRHSLLLEIFTDRGRRYGNSCLVDGFPVTCLLGDDKTIDEGDHGDP